MGRRRAFDEDDIVEAAMQLFWKKGFERATLDELMEQTNISKSSLYNTFSSKGALLEKVLARYGETWMAGLLEPLSRPEAGRAEIEESFATLAARFSGPLAKQGCLMTNCAIDVAPHDAVAQKLTAALRGSFERILLAAVERGQAQGTISRSEPALSLARALTNALNGMSVLAKLNPRRAALEDIARLSLRILD